MSPSNKFDNTIRVVERLTLIVALIVGIAYVLRSWVQESSVEEPGDGVRMRGGELICENQDVI
jgi:hypothetical protein